MDARAKASFLRTNMTDAEQHLWKYLRRRQQNVGYDVGTLGLGISIRRYQQ